MKDGQRLRSIQIIVNSLFELLRIVLCIFFKISIFAAAAISYFFCEIINNLKKIINAVARCVKAFPCEIQRCAVMCAEHKVAKDERIISLLLKLGEREKI